MKKIIFLILGIVLTVTSAYSQTYWRYRDSVLIKGTADSIEFYKPLIFPSATLRGDLGYIYGTKSTSSGLSIGSSSEDLININPTSIIFRFDNSNRFFIDADEFSPVATQQFNLGSSAYEWNNFRMYGNLGVNVNPSGTQSAIFVDTLFGSSSSGGNLFLGSTSHATKGKIRLSDTTLVVDITNNRVGVGTASPAGNLHIYKTSLPNLILNEDSDAWLGLMASDDYGHLIYFDSANVLRFGISSNNIATSGFSEKMRLTVSGNLGLGQTTFGTSAAKVLAIGNGTAPSTAPADAVQLWSADYAAGDARLYLKTESGTANIVLGNDQIVVSSLLKCTITAGGTVTARTFTVNVRKFDGVAPTNLRILVKWWVSTSEYGAASTVAYQTYEVTTGQELYDESTTAENHACTDASGNMVLTITNSQTGSPTAMYFHCEVQGIVYTANGTVNTGTL